MLQYITLQQRLHPGIMGHCSAAVGAADGAIKMERYRGGTLHFALARILLGTLKHKNSIPHSMYYQDVSKMFTVYNVFDALHLAKWVGKSQINKQSLHDLTS